MVTPAPPARALLVSALLLVIGGALLARGQQTPPARTLAGSDVVTVDFIALGRDGRPLLDLKPEDVTLRIDGKARALKSLQLMTPGGAAAAEATTNAPPPFATNAAVEAGRSFALVIDDETIRPGNEPPMRQAIAEFLAGLPASDQVAVATIPRGSIKVSFTRDRDRVKQVAEAITGQAPQRETMNDAQCRSRDTVQAFVRTIEVLGKVAPRTTFVLFSSSLTGSRSSVTMSSGGIGVANIGMCELLPEEFQKVGEAVAATQASVYIVAHDPVVASASPTGGTDNVRGSDSIRAGIDNIAGATGGVALALSSSTDTALARIARETAAYYLATFDADPAERSGTNHQMSLKIAREGATTRARPDVLIVKADSSAARNKPPSTQTLVTDARAFADLPIRVAAYTARSGGDARLKIIAVAELADSVGVVAAASAGLFDESGRLIAQWNASASETGRPRIEAALLASAGTYRLRFAVTDVAGRVGTADESVTVELGQAGPLKLSALMFGLSREGGFQPRLLFGNEPAALAYFEIYGAQPGARVAITLEIAQTLNGPAVFSMLGVAAPTSEPDRYNVAATVPIGRLPPGDYVVRAIVGLEGQAEGRIVRTIRKAAQ